MTAGRIHYAYGPVPSRRLGKSLGINNIPAKVCSYSCIYCQVGRTTRLQYDRGFFFDPEDIIQDVRSRLAKVKSASEPVDYLTFVPDGEPTLDVNLGKEIVCLKTVGVPVGVITNASLLWREDVREELWLADWISLKIDAVREVIWRQVNRPHKAIRLSDILEGILAFTNAFTGKLVTETMLIGGLNDNEDCMKEVADFLYQIQPYAAYLSIPTRFDTGQGRALESNAQVLGVDLGKTDILVLSHGHFDHSGGVSQILQRTQKADIYCHPGVVNPRYAIRNGTPKSIQMPPKSMTAIDRLPSQHVHWVQQPITLFGKISITGPIPRETTYEDTGGPFYLDPEGRRPDPIEDDLALWIRTENGLAVCVGCAHAGLVNTLTHVQRLTHGLHIHAVIGGFHLLNASRERLEETLSALKAFKPDKVIPCHCTGEPAVAFLRDEFEERVLPGATGRTYPF